MTIKKLVRQVGCKGRNSKEYQRYQFYDRHGPTRLSDQNWL